jgi:hypothetical protein
MSPVTSSARASSPVADKTATPTRDSPQPEHDTSFPDVDMDAGAQQDAPDTGADISGTGTADNASTINKSTEIEKGKAPEKPKAQAQAKPEQTALEQTTPARPEKPAPQTPASEKTARAPAKTSAPAKTQRRHLQRPRRHLLLKANQNRPR